MKDKGSNDHWSECGLIFFHYGRGYKLAPDGQTVDIGSEQDIKEKLNGNTTTSGTGDMVRASPTRPARYRKKNPRRIKARQRLPLRKTHR
jgi:hypothetical protein